MSYKQFPLSKFGSHFLKCAFRYDNGRPCPLDETTRKEIVHIFDRYMINKFKDYTINKITIERQISSNSNGQCMRFYVSFTTNETYSFRIHLYNMRVTPV